MRNQEEALSSAERRRRLHELVIALIKHQDGLELLDPETPSYEVALKSNDGFDPARWLDRNQRVLKSYQALVRSALTIDALIEAETSFD